MSEKEYKPVTKASSVEGYLERAELGAADPDIEARGLRAIGAAFDLRELIPDDFFVTKTHAGRLIGVLDKSWDKDLYLGRMYEAAFEVTRKS